MLSPAPLKNALYYPVTSSVALAAVALTGIWWLGRPADDLVMNSLVWEKWQVWRALTASLLHVNFFHLAFDVYWFWTFGTLVEHVFGHLRCAAIFLLLAFGSMLAEYSVLAGGVGLSGVGYGLWGMLWILEQRDGRFAGSVDTRTSQMFIGWFFLCIFLTVTGVMRVANVAHGVGALMGILLGFAISGEPATKWKSIVALAAVTILAFLGATVFWPAANFSDSAEAEVEQAGLNALTHHEEARAVRLLESAAHMKQAPARTWYNLGVAYQRVGRYAAAIKAFEHAADMPDADDDMREVGKDLKFPVPQGTTNR